MIIPKPPTTNIALEAPIVSETPNVPPPPLQTPYSAVLSDYEGFGVSITKEELAESLGEPKTDISDGIAVPPLLEKIAKCESGNSHFEKDGVTVLRGKINPHDIGRYQISETHHIETAQKMGLDIYDEKDNEKFAVWLFSRNGAKDWAASENCWNK